MTPRTKVLGSAGLSVVAGLGLSGCVSATSVDRAEQGAETTVSTSAMPVPQCDLLTAGYLRDELGTAFRDGRPLHGSDKQRTECQWAAKSGIALVKTVVDEDGSSYADTRMESQRSLGLVTDVDVPGAKRAFQVPGYGMTGMLISGKYVQVVVAVPTASPEAVRDVAESVAANVAGQD